MEKVSMSHEDYLEAIVKIIIDEKEGDPNASIRSVDLHKKLGVTKASVSKALGILSSKGLVEKEHYRTLTLTPEGWEYGNAILARENLLITFMTEVLGISKEIAEEESCLMEHAISDESFEKWKAYIESLNLEK